jgi:hypothetical protein
MAPDPALEACLLEMTGQVAASRNVLPPATEHEPAAHQQAASDGIAMTPLCRWAPT